MSPFLPHTLAAATLWAALGGLPAISALPTAGTGGDSCRQRLVQALDLFRNGQKAEAATALAQVGSRCDDADTAAEALFRAAQLEDEQLAHPALAIDLYRQTATTAPHSTYGERAARRASELSAMSRRDPAELAALQELNQLTSGYQTLGFPTVIARLQRLLTAQPSLPTSDRALYLLGTAYRDSGQEAAAATTFRQLLTTQATSRWAPYALQALGILDLRRGDFRSARDKFRQLKQRYGDALWSNLADEGLLVAERELARQRLATFAWAYLLGVLSLLGVRGRRQLWPPPVEVRYYLPIASFLVAVSTIARGGQLRAAMLGLTAAGTLFIWLGAAAARASFPVEFSSLRRPPSPSLRSQLRLIAGLLGRGLAASALCYLILYHCNLVERVLETLRAGPEAG